jgi:hypothetical protein
MLLLPLLGAAAEERPGIQVVLEGHRWQLSRLVVDEKGWHVRTEHGINTELADEQIVRAEISMPADAPALFFLRDGQRVEALTASYFLGRWDVKTTDVTDTHLQPADISRIEAELPAPDEPPAPTPGERNPVILRFSAEIDYAERFFIQGNTLRIARQAPTFWNTSEGPIRNVEYTFERPLPARLGCYYLDNLKVGAEAEWELNQPTGENGYTCVIRVLDYRRGYHKLSFVLRECCDMSDPLPRVNAPWSEYAVRRLTYRIPARSAWWDTGWEVEPGSEVSIYCSGQWQIYRKDQLHWAGPSGVDRLTSSETLVPHMRAGAVVARTDRDAAFYVGIFARRSLENGGRLFLSQNGVPDEIKKSKGQMTVVIQGSVRQAQGGALTPGAAVQ